MPPFLVQRPLGTADILFMYFPQEITLEFRGQEASAPPHTLMLWKHSAPHTYGNTTMPWRHSWIHLDGKIVTSLAASIGVKLDHCYTLPNGQLFERFLEDIYAELSGVWPPHELIVTNLLENFLRQLHRLTTLGNAHRELRTEMVKVREYLESHVTQPLSVPQMAAMAGMSAPHFSEEFRRAFGMPPARYLTNLRMEQALHFLRDRNSRVNEVAQYVGYDDVFHFSRMFKKHFGFTPNAARNPGAAKATENR
jgi:AraC-like DNA-binding protein